MLIDYHMHLVDDYFIGPCPYTPERVAQYVDAAQRNGIAEIGVTDHCYRFAQFKRLFQPIYGGPRGDHPEVSWLKDNLNESLDRYVEALVIARQRGLPVKIGLEVDWLPGREEEIREILSPYPFDYILGSVHFIDDWPVDVSAEYGWPELNVEHIYARYFSELQQAARSGLYDVLAHPDLIKKFGHRIEDPQKHYEDVVKAVVEADVALEISTAGLHYPVAELYPAEGFLHLAARRGVPITLASDAHYPEHVGRSFDEAVAAARRAGYTHVATFTARKRSAVPLPASVNA